MYGFEYITEDNVIMTSIFLYEWKIYRHFIQKFFKHNFENIKQCFSLPNCSHINLKKIPMDSIYLAYYALTSNLFVFVSVCKVIKKLYLFYQ